MVGSNFSAMEQFAGDPASAFRTAVGLWSRPLVTRIDTRSIVLQASVLVTVPEASFNFSTKRQRDCGIVSIIHTIY
jgi:hypothetical protein